MQCKRKVWAGGKKLYTCKKGNAELNSVAYHYSLTTEQTGIYASLIVIPEKQSCFTFCINVPIQSNVEHRLFWLPKDKDGKYS